MRYLLAISFLLLASCASGDRAPATKAHSAATGVSDIFLYDSGMPSREPGKKTDFFSTCEQKGFWRPFATKTEYSCTGF